MDNLNGLDNSTLLAHLRSTLGNERQTLASFLRYLAEVEARGLHAQTGHPSLFSYCTMVLALKEAEAYSRIHAARQASLYPVLLDRLTNGSICLTTIRQISPHLTAANIEKILATVGGKTTREIDKIVVTLAEAARPAARAAAPRNAAPEQPPLFSEAPSAAATAAPKLKPDRLRYVTPQQVEVRFTANEALVAKLDRAKGLARSKGVGSTLEGLFDHVIEVYLNQCDPERRLKRQHNRRPRAGSAHGAGGSSRYIPQAVKDTVYARDGGRCVYTTAEGQRCPALVGLEYEHRTPHARGGSSIDPANIELLCRTHNQLAAKREFGEGFIADAVRYRRQSAVNTARAE